MTTEAAAKKDTQKLQRAIVDGLEDVKAQDIRVFDTEHLSALFERVIVASGTSNRQTKALASSVRDAVRDAGFSKPRIEGEDNGEWIIVDCGAAVAHIMQPAIRQYYHLEEIWGEKPIRLRLGASKPAAASSDTSDATKARPAATSQDGKSASPSLRRASAARTAHREADRSAKAEKADKSGEASRAPKANKAVKAGSASVAKKAKPGPTKVPAKKAAAKRAAPKPPQPKANATGAPSASRASRASRPRSA